MFLLGSFLTTYLLSSSYTIQSKSISNMNNESVFIIGLEKLEKESLSYENSISIHNSLDDGNKSWQKHISSIFTRKYDDIFICVTSEYQELNLLLNTVNDFFLKINNIFTKPRIYIIVSSSSSDRSINGEIFLNNVTIIGFPIDAEVFFVFKDFKSGEISVWEKLCYKQVTVTRLIFKWLDHSNFESMKCMEKIHVIQKNFLPSPISYRGNRRYLDWISIAAVAQNDPDYQPRIKTVVHANGTADFVNGMCLDVLRLLQFLLKFNYTAVDGLGWVGLINGTWTGMSGQVVNGEAELSISQASTIMMADQVGGISFLHPTSTGTLIGIFRQPNLSSIRDIIISAFHPLLWFVYLLVWIILIISLKIIFRVIQSHDMDLEIDRAFTYESLMWALSALSNNGWYRTPVDSRIRLIFTISIFTAYFLYVAYSASMTTNLTTETLPIKDSKELEDSSIVLYADKWLPMAHTVIEDMYRQRKKVIKDPELYYNQLELIIPTLMNHSWAFVTFSDATDVVFHRLNFSDVYFCEMIYTVVVSKSVYPNAMYVKRGSPLKEIFNTRILLTIERGFLSRLNRIYDRDTQIVCSHKSGVYRGGLSIRDTITPFLFIIGGLMTSLIILIWERKPKWIVITTERMPCLMMRQNNKNI